ncbi:MAG: cyclopropane fatty acyl phospholipid synthase [Candidatus Accumulibacter regalis]|jgi:methionine biosynthesis protein MetW|uniref:Cyclopropane fatty acyl phospholipid synthase n=1 Tax=Accumulibacter regalis TaxID=522306 RepID=A0A011QJ86_ACCRE|nr:MULTISPECIES: methionine biosynthesis protein MetW [unclassified Candidatus Accumulibacter]EXI89080.1 MAG: cyclopropane fatty acyl phospholipid synthase [Candidatus Accumulibacter regalis]MQM33507.1 methionine biosynthesis protein MetW [Candidatus Accumulibacter phosphatis]MBL8367074.1 methionine biosynthesis protein MetW [Accumulibacter sp.]MBN8516259.1 methionine biosynthesis protein MetW [Accumulibacter sp.]MBO3704292.1 methionine biosynthesis protein MetW [Accumulibacter sp.]
MTEHERRVKAEQRERFDFAVIANWLQPGERVLDLGCGDGRLLRYLDETRDVTGYGVEIDQESVLGCIRNGVDVIQMNIESGLQGFEDHSFDRAIISQALQTMHTTERILSEMLRVAHEAVVSFPNFAYRSNRAAIAAGHMPVSEDLPYDWFDTPNVRFFTIVDFEDLCARLGIEIRERLAFDEAGREVADDPNLNGSLAFYRLGRKS